MTIMMNAILHHSTRIGRGLLRMVLLAVLLVAGNRAMAYDFMADGLYYNVNEDDTTVSVTHEWGDDEFDQAAYNYIQGDVVIPSRVTHDGTTYTVTAIDQWAFYYCVELTSVEIPSTVTSIGVSAFYGCHVMTRVLIPASVTVIEEGAFYRCVALTAVSLPEGLTSLGDMSFAFCSGLTAIDFPESLTSIGDYAFYSCSGLTDVVIPHTVTHVGNGAFVFCYSLTSVVVGRSVDMLWFAFWGCDNVTSVTCYAEIPPYMGLGVNGETHEKVYTFTDQVYRQAVLYVPEGSVDAYKRANQWKNFTRILPIGTILGDVNDDSEVTLADVNAVIGAVINMNYTSRQDVNGDGEVNLADVNALLDIILAE